jgi:hypothetical protein
VLSEAEISRIEAVAAAVKDRAHSFNYIRRTTGLKFTDDQFLDLIEDRLQFTRIRRAGTAGNRIQPGWPGAKLRAAATT